ncbi:MAG: DNA polymerase III subunit alpha [Bacteroidota bacterium]|nr:DNA polymerase III subunit alpha [Bacteroidota bacterium]
MPDFAHLHVHTQYSILDGAAPISSLIKKVKDNGMKSIAITDHGDMYGVAEFVKTALKSDIKPIIGCEFYIAPNDRFDRKDSTRYHQLLLAKNMQGYKNLAKLCSLGFVEGYYYKPRIDKELIRKYKEGLIATTCCLAGEIPRTILRKGEEAGEKVFLEWLDIFGDDYYIELQRHDIEDQNKCNEILLKWSKKYNVKVIATNDVHYIDHQDSQAQDILLCLQTGKDYDDPNRMRFDGDKFYLKTKEEMAETFSDIPEALENTIELTDKVEIIKLDRKILLPVFPLPEGFAGPDDYLTYLCFEGAKKRYGALTDTVKERIDYELSVIKNMGFGGYFLIVQDFISAARKLGVSVGPGRGSAAGSVVAYCIGITNIDPLKYDLLFERFLNPERISMPDIDIDFDDDGRQRVIGWVIEKYGKERVAQIVTFGTMAAKSAIKDVARVLKLPLQEANRLTKLVPDKLNTTLKKAFEEVKELAEEKKGDTLVSKTLYYAEALEGSVRQTGIHAAGVIIAPDNLIDYVPLCTAKDAELLVTQYEGKYIESVGMLKMDFLGLRTLSIIKDAINLIKSTKNLDVEIDTIPLDDAKTLELYQKGDTIGTFQFESDGMRAYLKELKPTSIDDLIAMNALYRPGPMDYIPQFIDCKTGKKKVEYPHPLLEGILKNTYGIMVYQEQIMQTAQIMAGFSLGSADLLRRAMGKKDMATMEKQKGVFIEGAVKNGVDAKNAEDVFGIMTKFAEYGFNKSHSAAYSVLAYQTGYLKAHYPAEYMAAVLSRNMDDIKKVSFYMDECKKMGIRILGPDINESNYKFVVNKKGEIRFGLGAVKGVGEAAIEAILAEINEHGQFKSIFDLTKRINLRAVNKKCLEALAYAGAFDSFEGVKRSQYFYQQNENDPNLIERAIRYGGIAQSEQFSVQQSLFGDEDGKEEVPEPTIPQCEEWNNLELLKYEKEVIGLYLSGHPLDDYKIEMENFCNITIADLNTILESKTECKKNIGKEFSIAGIVTDAVHKFTKTGKPMGTMDFEDYSGQIQFAFFSDDYVKNTSFLSKGWFLYIKGKIQNRFRSEDIFEFKIQSISLLSEVFSKHANSLTLNIPVVEINENLIKQLISLIEQHNKGKCKLKINIFDHIEKVGVEMTSRKYTVDGSGFLRDIRKMTEIKYKLG